MKQLCKDCKAVEWCQHAFGRHHAPKSHGGVGCNAPFPQDERTVAAAMRDVRRSDTYNPF